MSRKTSFDEIYSLFGALVNRATGRTWYRKAGLQVRPKGQYALVYLSEAEGIEKPVVESVELDDSSEEEFQQISWSTSYIKVRFEFYGSRANDTALQAATRAKNSLYLEERFWDIWEVCAISGGVRIIDLSEMFREDVEQRAEVQFTIVANISDPLPLEDANIFDIDSQRVDVIHVRQDSEEFNFSIDVENDSESS